MSICQAMSRKPTHSRTPRFRPIWCTWPARGRRAFACNPTYASPGSTSTTYSGSVDIVNQANSPYGAGWSLDNGEQLVSVSGGMMLVNPDGTSLYFANNDSGGYITPAGDFSTLTLSNGVYTRTLTDGTQINFNSSGQKRDGTRLVDSETARGRSLLRLWALPLAGDWAELVIELSTEAELAGVRRSVKPVSSHGAPTWHRETLRTMALGPPCVGSSDRSRKGRLRSKNSRSEAGKFLLFESRTLVLARAT